MEKKRRAVKILVWLLEKEPKLFGKYLMWLMVKFSVLFRLKPHPEIIWLAKHFNYQFPVTARLYNGMKIKVFWNETTVGQKIYQQGFYEKDTVKLFSKLLTPSMICFDIGGHCGQYTLVASKRVGSTGEVHSFEPDPNTFSLLSESVKLNNLKNVCLNQLALSDLVEVKQLYMAGVGNVGGNSLYQLEDSWETTCQVNCTTLDSYLQEKNLNQIDLMKVDIEGYEMNVIGSSELIKNSPNQPIIIIEFNEYNQNKIGKSCQEMANFLKSNGYELCLIGKRYSAGVDYSRIGIDAMFNVLAVPEARIPFIEKVLGVQLSSLPLDNNDGMELKVLSSSLINKED